MSERFTPGPWFVATGCSWRRILQERTDAPVIVPTNSQHDGHPDLMGGQENLQLAAAAPDLYAALKAYVDACKEQDLNLGGITGDAVEALAKARGETP